MRGYEHLSIYLVDLAKVPERMVYTKVLISPIHHFSIYTSYQCRFDLERNDSTKIPITLHGNDAPRGSRIPAVGSRSNSMGGHGLVNRKSCFSEAWVPLGGTISACTASILILDAH